MAAPLQSRDHLSFGDYELDCRTGELRRNGTALKLQPQPAKILGILAQRAGEVVTRQELTDQVWGTGTYVDFEHGLNFAVRKIRSVLEDDPENPRYLETVPKRGYRFIATVTSNGHNAPPIEAAVPKTKRQVWKLLSSIALLLAIVALTWYLRRSRPEPEKAPIVLGEFVNRTGDAVFDGTLREGLSVQLEQSPYLRFVSEEQVRETLRLMNRPTDTALSLEVSREICQRVNATVTFVGSIDLIGRRYILALRAIECATGNAVTSAETQAADKNHVLEAVSKLASAMRRKLGEPLSSIRQYDIPLASVTTPSIEALRCYTEGIQSLSKEFNYTESLSWFQKAIELDPDFAMAHWAIGDVYAILGETNSAVEYTRKAFELRGRASVREKALIEANYYYYVVGDVEKARHACEFLSKLYAFSADAHNSVAVFAETVGQYDVGLREYLDALRLAPESSFLYRDLAYTYLVLDRIDDASAIVSKAHTMDLDANLAAVTYSIAFYRNDRDEMAHQVANATGKPETENLLLAMDADTAAYSGRLRAARALSRRASESAQRVGRKETAALYDGVSALREALFGNSRAAQQRIAALGKNPAGRDVAYSVALALLFADDLAHGQAATEALARNFPQDSVVQCNYLPTLRARLALMHSNSHEAIELLSQTGACEFGLPVYSYYNWPNLYPAYVRADAYLSSHRAAEALAELHKILAHRGLVLNEPIAALARLQLGRAYVLAGDTAKARDAYQSFFALWKDGDLDIPILRQARAEYEKLR